ncbi:cationic amino acid transporter 3-like [Biomphalaria glabrata]|uniref:Cationic amino acid transporter 3-like n=2 Tax=Biomphalaria TaxID=6525 RepID=A0A2C9JTP0_BIOGL|nr:cationic amino acid transporter 3-like [Biomphalaria glabrata]XP_055864957.1 cationic amino acid transporter 3-like [Biomphalaria glabrata]
MRWCRDLLETVSRQKPWDVRSLHQTELSRSLNVVELIGIGIGSCAGLGIFVTSAHAARYESGPGVVLSVLVASLAALLSGLCHIELATRLPRSGTGYVFCYVTLGELLAFVIGWSVILENVINGAVAAKALWQYVEYMYNYTDDSNVTESTTSVTPGLFETTPDYFPSIVVLVVIVLSFITVKRYAIVNFVLMSLSGLVVLAFICVGFFHVDANNWNSTPGFFAHGLGGIMSGAGLMMSSFISVDNLASCAEESRTPCKSLPTAFGFSLAIVFSLFFLVTSALTLATPWQNLADSASLARAYETKGIFAANYVVGAGAVIGLLPVVFGSFVHPVRVMYSMSGDNLLPKFFSKLGYNGIPVCPHFITGLLIAFCTLVVNVKTLLEMSSIATILQFISSAIITLFIRYQPLPVGICREYSDLELAGSTCDDGLDAKDVLDFNESRPKLVLLSNGECKLSKDENLYSSIPEKLPKTISQTSAFSKNKVNGYPKFSEVKSQELTTAAAPIRFTNRFKKLNSIATQEMYTEKDSLRTNVTGNYGIVGGLENGIRGGNPEFYTDSPKTVNTVLTLSGTIRSVSSSVSSSLVALSPGCQTHADERTWRHTRYFLLIYILSSTGLATLTQVWPADSGSSWWAVTLLCISLVILIACALSIARQPQNSTPLYFKTPYVPLVPLLAVSINMLLLASLPLISWTRFSVWLLPGLLLYTCYSQRHSCNKQQDEQDVVLFDISQLQSAAE